MFSFGHWYWVTPLCPPRPPSFLSWCCWTAQGLNPTVVAAPLPFVLPVCLCERSWTLTWDILIFQFSCGGSDSPVTPKNTRHLLFEHRHRSFLTQNTYFTWLSLQSWVFIHTPFVCLWQQLINNVDKPVSDKLWLKEITGSSVCCWPGAHKGWWNSNSSFKGAWGTNAFKAFSLTRALLKDSSSTWNYSFSAADNKWSLYWSTGSGVITADHFVECILYFMTMIVIWSHDWFFHLNY